MRFKISNMSRRTATNWALFAIAILAALPLWMVVSLLIHHPIFVAGAMLFVACMSDRPLLLPATDRELEFTHTSAAMTARRRVLPLLAWGFLAAAICQLLAHGFGYCLVVLIGVWIADQTMAWTVRCERRRAALRRHRPMAPPSASQ